MIGGIGNVLFSTYSQTLHGQDPVVTLVNPWGIDNSTWFIFAAELAMRDEPNIGFRC